MKLLDIKNYLHDFIYMQLKMNLVFLKYSW